MRSGEEGPQEVDTRNKKKKRGYSHKHSQSSSIYQADMPLTEASKDEFRFPVEEIAKFPLPGFAVPSSLSFSPDDRLVSYLYSPDGSLHRKVCAFDIEKGKQEVVFSPPDGGGLDESNMSAEEKLRRERTRERGLGVTRYEWVSRNSYMGNAEIMVPLPSGIFFQKLYCHEPELKLPSIDPPIIDPHLSPDGSMIAYVKDQKLFVLNLSNGESKCLSCGASINGKTHGLAEYISLEEMDRKAGFWWSPDSMYIAFTEVDSSEIPLFRIMHQGKCSVGPDSQEDHAYPFAGACNVKVRLGVVSSSGGDVTWMDLLCGVQDSTNGDEEYLARVNWMPDTTLAAQVLNRSQNKLKLLKFDIHTGQRKILLVEEQKPWVNLHDCFMPLEKRMDKLAGGFIWASEKSGFRHLYLHDNDGSCLGAITEGDWMVEHIAGINESTGHIYFTGTMDGPLHTNLYCTNLFLDWGLMPQPQRLTHGNGRHVVTLDHQLQKFVDVHDSLDTPPRILLCSLHDGSIIMPLFDWQPNSKIFKNPQFSPPEIIEIPSSDGTKLYAALYKPDARKFGPPPYKTLINVYGGPGVQLVYDSWINTVDMRAQYLRNKGVLVWKLDNRGTARRGLEFEGCLKNNVGRIDAEDQLTGAEWLVKQGLAKAGHIGLYGWSYGGYLSAMTLARFPNTFCCAISGAPVSAFDGYDTFYTEKYMGLPSENAEGYEYSSVMHHVPNMKGKLMLVHGMIDENVHLRHTARLINALIAAGKPYELLLFPDERHMPRCLQDRVYMEERIWDFVERNL